MSKFWHNFRQPCHFIVKISVTKPDIVFGNGIVNYDNCSTCMLNLVKFGLQMVENCTVVLTPKK